MLLKFILINVVLLLNLFSIERIDLSNIDYASYDNTIINDLINKSNNKCNMLNNKFGCELTEQEIINLIENLNNPNIKIFKLNQSPLNNTNNTNNINSNNLSNVKFEYINNNLIIKIPYFNKYTAIEIQNELKKEPKEITLDLRDSNGGLLNGILETIGLFVEKNKELFKIEDKYDSRIQKPIKKIDSIFYDKKINILTNENTINGSALFVYCLKNNNNNVILLNKEIGYINGSNIFIKLFENTKDENNIYILNIKNSEFKSLDNKIIQKILLKQCG